MSLVGRPAQAHPQQVSRRWPDDIDGVDDRATHPLDFAEFEERHGPFLPGRMRFLKPGQTAVGPNQRPPFGCVLLTWTPGVDELVYEPDRIPAGGLFEEDPR